MLAERGVVISAGKMSGLWSGQPNTIRLDGLDVICAVLGCGVEEVLLPEPDSVPAPTPASTERTAAIGQDRAVRLVEHRAGILLGTRSAFDLMTVF